MRNGSVSKCAIFLIAIVLLFAVTTTAKAQIKPDSGDPNDAKVMEEGLGWKLLEVPDPNATEKNAKRMVWMINEAGIDDLPVSEAQKDEYRQDFAEILDDETAILFVDVEVAEDLEAGRWPEAFGDPPKGSLEAGIEGLDPEAVTRASCPWTTKVKNYNYNFSEFSQQRTFSLGSINGSFDVSVPLSGAANLVFTYQQKKADLLFFCAPIPHKFRFVSAQVSGNLDIAGDGDVAASVTLSDSYSKEWKLFEPTIADTTFFVGPIPVRIKVTLPVYAGLALDWSVTGTIGLDADFGAGGTFNYFCDKNNCTGTNTFTDNFELNPTSSIQASVKAQANARVMARVALYSASIGFVEAGVKGFVETDLWGYLGNTCGDADGNGQNETVRALVADLNWGYDIRYGIGGWLLPDKDWTVMGGRYPLGWFDLLGSGQSTALQPMLTGPATVTEGTGGNYTVRMRPCYPYSERVNFSITPGTWSGNKFIPMPKSSDASQNRSAVSRGFNTPGPVTLVVTNQTDGNGRNINVPYSRTIQVLPSCTDNIQPTVSVTSPSAGGRIWGTTTLQASASDNVAVTKVEFFINGALKCTDVSAPYTCATNVDGYPTGNVNITAKAHDGCGNSRTSSVVTARVVSNPELFLQSPASGATVTGSSVSISGWATDPNGVNSVTVMIDGQSSIPSNYGTNRPDVCSSVPVNDPNCPAVGFATTLDSTLFTNGTHSIRVEATDAQGKKTSIVRNFTIDNPPPASCTPGPTTLCLRNNRFKVEVQYVNGSTFGAGKAVTSTDQSGFFWFFGPNNLEAGVKVLGPASNGYYWVYTGAATDREYTLAVTDTQTGAVKSYFKPAGSFCGTPDTQAFPAGSTAPLAGFPDLSEATSFYSVGKIETIDAGASRAVCTPSSTALCLQNSRFKVEVLRGSTPQQGAALTSETGSFWFFSSQNQEVFVKVLNGSTINNKYWVFYGSMSSQQYTVRVTDTVTGQVVTYDNPLGNYCGNGDTTAFPAP